MEAWGHIRFCPPPLMVEPVGFIVTRVECNTNVGNPGSNSGGGNEPIGTDPNNPPLPTEVPIPKYYQTNLTPLINITLASGPSSVAVPIVYGMNNSKSPLMWARLEEPSITTGPASLRTRFILLPDGKVGFNVSNPRATLDVMHSGGATTPTALFGIASTHGLSATDPNNPYGIYMRYSKHMAIYNNLPLSKYNGLVQEGDQAIVFTDGKGTDGANMDGALTIGPWRADNSLAGLRMDKDGNSVLGGTLEVQGRITCSGITSKPKWWPDFVFDKDFKLITLDSIEKFILLNKHLPGMPSEKQIMLTGIEHTEILQLQQLKIEELTLYTIELMKLITEQKRQLELLNSRIQEVSTK